MKKRKQINYFLIEGDENYAVVKDVIRKRIGIKNQPRTILEIFDNSTASWMQLRFEKNAFFRACQFVADSRNFLAQNKNSTAQKRKNKNVV